MFVPEPEGSNPDNERLARACKFIALINLEERNKLRKFPPFRDND